LAVVTGKAFGKRLATLEAILERLPQATMVVGRDDLLRKDIVAMAKERGIAIEVRSGSTGDVLYGSRALVVLFDPDDPKVPWAITYANHRRPMPVYVVTQEMDAEPKMVNEVAKGVRDALS